MTRHCQYPLQPDIQEKENKAKVKRNNKQQQQQQHRRAKSTPNNMANYIKQHEIPSDPHTFGTTAPHLIW